MHTQVRPNFLNSFTTPAKITRANSSNTDTNMQNSPTHITYSPSHGPGGSTLQQQSPSAMSRLRATSAAFPAGLDLRTQYRPMPSQANSPHGLPATPRSSSFANAFTGGYASAPLTAPVVSLNFSIHSFPRYFGFRLCSNVPQLLVHSALGNH